MHHLVPNILKNIKQTWKFPWPKSNTEELTLQMNSQLTYIKVRQKKLPLSTCFHSRGNLMTVLVYLVSFLRSKAVLQQQSFDKTYFIALTNRPCSIYQYSSMAPRLSDKNCDFFKFLLSLNSPKWLGYKENNTKYSSLTWKPRSHVRILPVGHVRYIGYIEHGLFLQTLSLIAFFKYPLDKLMNEIKVKVTNVFVI